MIKRILLFSSLTIILYNCQLKQKNTQKNINNDNKKILNKKIDIIKDVNKLKVSKPDYSYHPSQIKNVEDSAKFINFYFKQFITFKDSLSEIYFFTYLPSTFEKHSRLYKYDEKRKNQYLYSERHIFKYDEYRKFVPLDDYISKLINISMDARWHTSYNEIYEIRRILDRFMWDSPKLFVNILNRKTKKEIQNYWTFYFDGPHPMGFLPDDLKDSIVDKEMIKIMEQTLKKVQEEWEDGHGH